MREVLPILVLSVILVAGMHLLVGCVNPPNNMVLVDTDGDGRMDRLAEDANKDGIPDVDVDGAVKIVPGSEVYANAEKVDAIAPTALEALGGVLSPLGWPAALLAGIGAAWKNQRFGRIFANTVMSVQLARQRLKDKGSIEALAILDETLDGSQAGATVKMIRDVKDKIGSMPVTPDAG